MADPFSKSVTTDGIGRGNNFVLGLLAGIIAALIGAGIWMAITLATNLHLGLVAIAIGALVGFAIRTAGNGRSPIFGILGAALTLAGCLLGEILTFIQLSTTPQNDFYTVATTMDYSQALSTIFSHISPMGYLIYGIGIYEGYKLSIRR